MPYIKEHEKESFEIALKLLRAGNCGELNFLFTKILQNYLKDHGVSYQTCNDIVGALDNAKDEFRRRILHPYENKKIEMNGDVY